MVSAIRHHGTHADWSARAMNAHLDANVKELAAATRARIQQQNDAETLQDMWQSQRSLLDLLA
jgi:hypothetical protein